MSWRQSGSLKKSGIRCSTTAMASASESSRAAPTLRMASSELWREPRALMSTSFSPACSRQRSKMKRGLESTGAVVFVGAGVIPALTPLSVIFPSLVTLLSHRVVLVAHCGVRAGMNLAPTLSHCAPLLSPCALTSLKRFSSSRKSTYSSGTANEQRAKSLQASSKASKPICFESHCCASTSPLPWGMTKTRRRPSPLGVLWARTMPSSLVLSLTFSLKKTSGEPLMWSMSRMLNPDGSASALSLRPFLKCA